MEILYRFGCCGAVGKTIFIPSFALEGLNQTVKRKERYGKYRAQHDGQCVNKMLKTCYHLQIKCLLLTNVCSTHLLL